MPEGRSTATAIADEMLFVHEGSGVCDTIFGPLRYGPGDYLVLPIGTTWRLDPDAGSDQRMLYLEAPSEIEPPKRYRNDYGQLLEHSPYSQRDLHAPDDVAPRDEQASSSSTSGPPTGSRPTTTGTTRSTSSAGTATSGRSGSTSATSSRSPGASTSRRRSTRRSRRGTSWSARSCPASSTTTRSRSRRRTTTRTSTATRSSTTSPATS